MSEEYETVETVETQQQFSPFYPLLILLVGFIGWFGYQVYEANSQRSAAAAQVQQMLPTIGQAQDIRDRYVKLMKDLLETAQKDPQAAQIVKDAMAAGLLRVQQPAPGEAGASTNAAPAAPDASAPAPATK